MRINRVRALRMIHFTGRRVVVVLPYGIVPCECSRIRRAAALGIPCVMMAANRPRP